MTITLSFDRINVFPVANVVSMSESLCHVKVGVGFPSAEHSSVIEVAPSAYLGRFGDFVIPMFLTLSKENQEVSNIIFLSCTCSIEQSIYIDDNFLQYMITD